MRRPVSIREGKKDRLIAGERQRRIVQLLRDTGIMRVRALASALDVSDETIRRDLVVLEGQGVLTRTYGGATAEGVHLQNSYFRRTRQHEVEKRLIAIYAASLIQDGSTVIIDSGTTMGELVKQLRAKRDLVVITNGVNHVEELLNNPTTTVVVTGGVVRRATQGIAGELAVATMRTLHADQTFIATQGFSTEAGLTYPSFDEVDVKLAMIGAGAEVTLLADGSKCGRAAMVKVAPLADLDRIVTTEPLPDDERRKVQEIGIELIALRHDEEADVALQSQVSLRGKDARGGPVAPG